MPQIGNRPGSYEQFQYWIFLVLYLCFFVVLQIESTSGKVNVYSLISKIDHLMSIFLFPNTFCVSIPQTVSFNELTKQTPKQAKTKHKANFMMITMLIVKYKKTKANMNFDRSANAFYFDGIITFIISRLKLSWFKVYESTIYNWCSKLVILDYSFGSVQATDFYY